MPDLRKLLSSKWAIISAENPARMQVSSEYNFTQTMRLRAHLPEGAIPVTGMYKGKPEHGFLVLNPHLKNIRALATMFGQESVLTSDGLLMVDTDTLVPFERKKFLFGKEALKQDAFTRIGAQAFSARLRL
jgi:hypothetical protein